MILDRLLIFFIVSATAVGVGRAAHDGEFELLLRSREADSQVLKTVPQTWDATATAVIVCDMWDAHHCLNATRRGAELAPVINKFISRVRDAGGTVIHAPSSCMAFYQDHPARERAERIPMAKNLPVGIESWLDWIDEKEKAAGYPIDHSDGGEDDDPAEHAAWAKELEAKGKNPRAPWTRQAAGIRIDEDEDFITDNGKQNWSILESRGIDNVMLVGVHTNMCVLGRPFGLRQLARNGKNVVLVRDLTDTMYNPAMRPQVSHFEGTDLIIDHVETFVCPTISSEQLLGGSPHKFAADKRKHLVMLIGEKEYKTIETLPKFAREQLAADFRISIVTPDPDEPNLFPGIGVLDSADVLLVSVRRRALPEGQLAQLREHVAAGKPVVGIRTSSHAFSLRGKPEPEGHAVWEKWDPEVFGGNYSGHHGNKLKTFAKAQGEHAILAGVPRKEFATGGSLYQVRPLEKGAVALVEGRAEGVAEPEPVAWTFKRAGGGKSFYTSLGHVDDFANPAFVQLLANGVRWAAGIESDSKKKLNASAPATEFQLADDLEIDLVLAEPLVQQPLHLSFDERGRLWVVQYIQYPDPAGIREVSRDKVWRTVYDKVPPPPPHAADSPFRGKDKITIHEDTDGDGVFDKHKVFLDGLNLATSVAHGRGGVWVTNPPYLMFYPDVNRDDIPDGPPQVHLQGFGLEDTHSIASSLYWGPDGWLYGAQGSTVSAAILRPGIDKGDADAVKTMGQNVWRYHPERKIYEVFAEGGGNTFGVEIDSKGRVYSGHNGGDTRGFHYVQGGYYRKSFGKHGELTNPYGFGHFPAMKNAKVARFVHQFIIYEGDGLPERFYGKLLGVDVLHNNLVLSEISPLGSTFETRDLERPVATQDKNFRPVHIAEAPDGSVFIADWYDQQVNHYLNHEGQIDHEMGRVYRVRAKGKRAAAAPRDLASLGSAELIALLDSPSRWHRQTALRLLWDRGDVNLGAKLSGSLLAGEGIMPVETLWAIGASGSFDEKLGLSALTHPDPHLRLWAVRMLEDLDLFTDKVAARVEDLARGEENVEVLSQIACTAKRVDGKHGLAIAGILASRYELGDDPHLPLLIWWAIEARCEEMPDDVIKLVAGTAWANKVMQRSAMVGRRADLEGCAVLLSKAKDGAARNDLLVSLEKGLSGRTLVGIPQSLEAELAKAESWASLPIRLRQGAEGALEKAIEAVSGNSLSPQRRRDLVAALGQVDDRRVIPVLLKLAGEKEADAELRATAIASLAGFAEPSIASSVIDQFRTLPPAARAAAMDLLSSRLVWAQRLVAGVASKQIERSDVSLAHVEKLRQLDATLAESWPRPTAESGKEIARVKAIIAEDRGVPKKGEAIFNQRCAACHVMFNRGGAVGPDLTSYQKNDLDTLLLSVIDPGAEIREGYEQAIVRLKDGAVRSGFLVEQDEERLALRELSGTQRAISRADVERVEIVGSSLMPPGLLGGLDATQLRDLFAYLRSTTPPF